jgi:7-carboxy-7-deazaguanine synthase
VFGKNEIIGQKYFDNAGDKLFVTSIFMTMQGEGPYRGEPAVFVRLAKCNLACSFCDTYFDGGDWLTYEEVEQRIDSVIRSYFCKNEDDDVPMWAEMIYQGEEIVKKRSMVLVITGGEPMLQKNLVPFLYRMNTRFAHTQIESNGTVWQDIPEETTLVCSPKCLEKDGRAVKYLQPNQRVMDRADCLKFVMSADQASPYSNIPDWAHDYSRRGKKVFISPMNIYNREPQKSKQMRSTKNDITLEERSQVDEIISFWEDGLLDMRSNQANHEYTAQYCVKHGFTFNMQLHLFASLA